MMTFEWNCDGYLTVSCLSDVGGSGKLEQVRRMSVTLWWWFLQGNGDRNPDSFVQHLSGTSRDDGNEFGTPFRVIEAL